jgi:hypothetical protein
MGDSESLNAANKRVVSGLKLSFSLYAGTITECVTVVSDAAFVGVLAERVRFDISIQIEAISGSDKTEKRCGHES